MRSDRTQLPSMQAVELRESAEAEIKYWGLDAGLASPSSLTSNLATRFQDILNTEPDMRHCEERAALNTWKKLGPIRLSELALQSDVKLDLDDEKYKLEMPSAGDEDQMVRTVLKDGSDPEA